MIVNVENTRRRDSGEKPTKYRERYRQAGRHSEVEENKNRETESKILRKRKITI